MQVRNNEELFNSYTYAIQDTKIKIIPIVKRRGTDWEIRIFQKNQQGPVWTGQELTQHVIEDYGLPDIPNEEIDEINESVEWANQFLEYESYFNRKERGQAEISDLYELTSRGLLVDKISDAL